MSIKKNERVKNVDNTSNLSISSISSGGEKGIQMNKRHNNYLKEQNKEPKGRSVSGRSWKLRPQKRATSLIKTSYNNQVKSWEERQLEKERRKDAIELQKQLSEEKRQSILLKKQRRLENEKRRAENEYNQALKSSKTLNYSKVGTTMKAMSKKQLRQIKKTRINSKTGAKEFVPAYSK